MRHCITWQCRKLAAINARLLYADGFNTMFSRVPAVVLIMLLLDDPVSNAEDGKLQGLEEFSFCCTDVFNAIFSTGPAVALIITLFLDNLVPGTREERGLHVWQQLEVEGKDWWDDDYANAVRTLGCVVRVSCKCLQGLPTHKMCGW